MSTVDNVSICSFSFTCVKVEFYGIALILLAALMKDYGCGGMRAVEMRGTANEERFEQTAFLRHCMK